MESALSRCLLMSISNKRHRLVLTTGNKSELAVGYSTLYGDMAGGFDALERLSEDVGLRPGSVSEQPRLLHS